jgi:hypothetical protein
MSLAPLAVSVSARNMSLLDREEAAREVDVSVRPGLARPVQAEMLGCGYRRLSGRTGVDRAAGTEVTSYFEPPQNYPKRSYPHITVTP